MSSHSERWSVDFAYGFIYFRVLGKASCHHMEQETICFIHCFVGQYMNLENGVDAIFIMVVIWQDGIPAFFWTVSSFTTLAIPLSFSCNGSSNAFDIDAHFSKKRSWKSSINWHRDRLYRIMKSTSNATCWYALHSSSILCTTVQHSKRLYILKRWELDRAQSDDDKTERI